MTPGTPTVSVVIPCYNVADFVEDAVDSALEQTHPPLEIICVDDGSKDETRAVLDRLRAANPDQVRVIEGPHSGAPAARNAGLYAATGTFVQFLDADDLLKPTKLEHHVGRAGETGADIIAASYHRHLVDKGPWLRPVEVGDPWISLINGRAGITSANLWRREAVLEAGAWNEAQRSSQEYELMFRMLKRGAHLAFDETPLAVLQDRPDSVSNWRDPSVRERHIQLRADIVDYLQEQRLLSGTRRDAVLGAVFYQIRKLYPLSPDTARAYHDRIIPRGYVPPSGGKNSALYVLTYRLLGFAAAEKVRELLGRRPALTLKPSS
ncbi:MAG: glycosyltransferase family 2 protein [Bacteroidota bacterium]